MSITRSVLIIRVRYVSTIGGLYRRLYHKGRRGDILRMSTRYDILTFTSLLSGQRRMVLGVKGRNTKFMIVRRVPSWIFMVNFSIEVLTSCASSFTRRAILWFSTRYIDAYFDLRLIIVRRLRRRRVYGLLGCDGKTYSATDPCDVPGKVSFASRFSYSRVYAVLVLSHVLSRRYHRYRARRLYVFSWNFQY